MGLFDVFSTGPAEDAAASKTAGFDAGFNDAKKYINQGNAALRHGQRRGINALNTGNAQGQGYLDSALEPWQGVMDMANAGAGNYADATGVNG